MTILNYKRNQEKLAKLTKALKIRRERIIQEQSAKENPKNGLSKLNRQ